MSTDQQLLEQLRHANPVPADAEPPEAMWSAAVLLDHVERRSGTMQTLDRKTEPQSRKRRRGPLIGLAAAAIVLIVVGLAAGLAAILAGDDSGDPVAPAAPEAPASVPSALEVAELYYERFEAGDFAGVLALFAEDATFFWTDGTDTNEGDVFSSDQYDVPSQLRSSADWDGDGAVTSADSRAGLIMDLYATRVELRAQCTAVDETVTCTQDPISAFIAADNPLMEGEVIFTVQDGRIVHERNLLPWIGVGDEQAQRMAYQAWAGEQHPEREDELFNRLSVGQLIINPDTVDTHRALIADWQTGPG